MGIGNFGSARHGNQRSRNARALGTVSALAAQAPVSEVRQPQVLPVGDHRGHLAVRSDDGVSGLPETSLLFGGPERGRRDGVILDPSS
jgi:hypothetical protein